MPDATVCPDCGREYDDEPRHVIVDERVDSSERGVGELIVSRLVCPA